MTLRDDDVTVAVPRPGTGNSRRARARVERGRTTTRPAGSTVKRYLLVFVDADGAERVGVGRAECRSAIGRSPAGVERGRRKSGSGLARR